MARRGDEKHEEVVERVVTRAPRRDSGSRIAIRHRDRPQFLVASVNTSRTQRRKSEYAAISPEIAATCFLSFSLARPVSLASFGANRDDARRACCSLVWSVACLFVCTFGCHRPSVVAEAGGGERKRENRKSEGRGGLQRCQVRSFPLLISPVACFRVKFALTGTSACRRRLRPLVDTPRSFAPRPETGC